MAGNIEEIIDRIKGQLRGGQFEPYIDFIQFPNYKNFHKDLRVAFDFPLTVVVGQNGTGKSSLLHALYGAPAGFSPGRWWFGTDLDPIEGGEKPDSKIKLPDSEKAAFWYGYKEDGSSREVVKMRIRKPGNPDYWEPSRPILSFGMRSKDGKRDPAIKMTPCYINLKTQLNAFDRCFYYSDPESMTKKIDGLRYWEKIKEAGRKGRSTIQDFPYGFDPPNFARR